jgi:hypothetical protein
MKTDFKTSLTPGARFGRLTFVSLAESLGGRTTGWFKCDCGEQHRTAVRSVITGATRSCGCLRSETTTMRNAEGFDNQGGKLAVRRTPQPSVDFYHKGQVDWSWIASPMDFPLSQFNR